MKRNWLLLAGSLALILSAACAGKKKAPETAPPDDTDTELAAALSAGDGAPVVEDLVALPDDDEIPDYAGPSGTEYRVIKMSEESTPTPAAQSDPGDEDEDADADEDEDSDEDQDEDDSGDTDDPDYDDPGL